MIRYREYIDQLHAALSKVTVSDREGREIETQTAMNTWCEHTAQTASRNKTLYFIGNGASATMAAHMSADASKNGELRAVSFTNPALLTAISNDLSYEESYSYPLTRFANRGDTLISISSSGNSPNIIRALQTAKKIGLSLITLSGMKPDNLSRSLGDLNFYVPAKTYGIVECAHQTLLHCWLDQYEEQLKASKIAGRGTQKGRLPHPHAGSEVTS